MVVKALKTLLARFQRITIQVGYSGSEYSTLITVGLAVSSFGPSTGFTCYVTLTYLF
jgi:hypothetical protein